MQLNTWTQLLFIAAVAALPALAQAQAFASKPVTLVVPFPPGGGTDNMARLIAPGLSAVLGQPVLVDNRAGAGGNIGTGSAARARPDGYTLLVGNVSPMVINPHTYASLPADPMKEFVPIGLISQGPLVFVVSPTLPVNTMAEFVAYAKARPGKLDYASTGAGGITHIATELLMARAGITMQHVPYKGTAQATQDLLGGQVQSMADGMGSVMGLVKAGKVKALLSTADKRSPALPDVPIAAEAGVPDYAFYGWIGLFAPTGTPPEILRALKAALDKSLLDPKVQERILGNGAEPGGTQSTEDFARQVRADYERWGQVVRASGIRAE